MNNKYLKNLIGALFFIILLYVLSLVFWKKFANLILTLPVLTNIYSLVMEEFNNRSIIGLSLITFFGGLFFIGFPAEVVFLLYSKIGYNIFFIFFIMFIFTMLAQIINYGIGYFIERKWLEKYIKESKREFHYSLKKYDILFIIIINILPLPADLLSVFLGMIKYDFKKTLIYSSIGKILKFLFLIILFFLLNNFI